jgi:Bacterial regulatory helix-turn-helix protein, lysR family
VPQLNALKAFEAAARHKSFTHAAEELCVTQGAVSHQSKRGDAVEGIAHDREISGSRRGNDQALAFAIEKPELALQRSTPRRRWVDRPVGWVAGGDLWKVAAQWEFRNVFRAPEDDQTGEFPVRNPANKPWDGLPAKASFLDRS